MIYNALARDNLDNSSTIYCLISNESVQLVIGVGHGVVLSIIKNIVILFYSSNERKRDVYKRL